MKNMCEIIIYKIVYFISRTSDKLNGSNIECKIYYYVDFNDQSGAAKRSDIKIPNFIINVDF